MAPPHWTGLFDGGLWVAQWVAGPSELSRKYGRGGEI
jgi:hypothetical protein